MEKQVKMALSLLLIIVLSAILIYAIIPYMGYFLGSLILFVLFKPIYHFFLKRTRLNRQISAALVIVISIFIIVFPLYFFLGLIISEIQQLLLNQEAVMASIHSGDQLFSNFLSRFDIHYDTLQARLEGGLMDLFTQAANYLSFLILGSIQNLSQRIIGLIIMYFLFYYLLTGEDSDFMHSILLAIPFSKENTTILFNEFQNIVRTTIIASGAIAVIEGGILIASFAFFGIRGAFLWGSVAGILSFLPILGTPLIWVPASIVKFLQQDYVASIGIFATGILLIIADNSFLRPVIQKKIGKIHPFQSLVGIVIGISLFGLVGVIFGPLLLVYLYLTIKMFSKEYISGME